MRPLHVTRVLLLALVLRRLVAVLAGLLRLVLPVLFEIIPLAWWVRQRWLRCGV